MKERITIQVDDDCFGGEGRAFADWCEAQGYEVTRVPRVSGFDSSPPELWEQYCDSLNDAGES